MKHYPVAVRYGGARVIADLVEAAGALETARNRLISAELNVDRAEGISADERTRISAEIKRMRRALYANRIDVTDGGDLQAWDLASLVLAVGAAAEGEDV